MNINSSSYYSVSASTNKGMSGMVSGMDTENMVKQMLSGTQSKIDKQEALKQQVLWKQEIYQDIITSVNGFYSKHFDTAYDSTLQGNLFSASFFDAVKATVKSGNAVRVISADGAAAADSMRISVSRLASAAMMSGSAKLTGSGKLSGSELTEEVLNTALDKRVVLQIGAQEVTVDLNAVTTEQGIADAFNQALSNTGISDVSAKIYDGRLRIISSNPDQTMDVKSTSSALGLQVTGLSTKTVTDLQDAEGNKTGVMLQGTTTDPTAGITFDVSLDGITKSISLSSVTDTNGQITLESVKNELGVQISKAFGSYVEVGTENGGLTLSLKEGYQSGHELEIFGMEAKKLGFVPGASTQLSNSTELSQLGNFSTESLSGKRFSFTINNVEFSFDEESTVGDLVSKINSSDAGVRISYSTLSNTFQMEATSTGAQYGISVSQNEGNLLSVLFGTDKISGGQTVAGDLLTTGTVQGVGNGLDDLYSTSGASLSMTVNGKSYSFSLPENNGIVYQKADVESAFNSWLKSTFGEKESGTNNITYDSGKLTVEKGFAVSFQQTAVDLENAAAVEVAKKSDLALAFGFSVNGASNLTAGTTKVSDVLQLAGLDVQYKAGATDQTLENIQSVNGQSVSYLDGRLTLEGSGAVTLSDTALAELFGGNYFLLADGAMQANAVTAGQDAKAMINGTEITRSSNTFTVEGLTLELLSEGGTEDTVINAERDTEAVVEAVKSFVADYNTMLDKLNGYMDEDADYRNYAPLTTEQKKEMSENEIKLWEEKARTGLVRRDSTVSELISNLRSAMYSKPDGCKFALYNIGIETGNWQDKGKLEFDEAAFRKALSEDPQSVKTLFTDKEDGLASKITGIVGGATKLSVGTPGSLVKLAGAKGWSANAKTNTLYLSTLSINERLKELNDKYEAERQRYWNQFNSMEKIISQYNTQSNMFLQQTSGS